MLDKVRRQIHDADLVLGGQLAAGLAHDVAWAHGGQQRPGLGRREELRPSGNELHEQAVQPVHRQVKAVDQQPQRHGDVIHRDLTQARRAQCHNGDGARVGRVGLCGPARWRTPAPARTTSPARRRPVRRRRRGAARYGDPHPGRHRRPAASSSQYPSRVRAQPAGARTFSRTSRTSIVADRLCGSIPITTRSIAPAVPPPRPLPPLSTRRAVLLRAGQTPLEPHVVTVPSGAHAMRATSTSPAASR